MDFSPAFYKALISDIKNVSQSELSNEVKDYIQNAGVTIQHIVYNWDPDGDIVWDDDWFLSKEDDYRTADSIIVNSRDSVKIGDVIYNLVHAPAFWRIVCKKPAEDLIIFCRISDNFIQSYRISDGAMI